MNLDELMKEYNFEIDDIRWYLSEALGRTLLEYKDDPLGLTRKIWSGELETELYNMEERFLEGLKEDHRRNLCDEAKLREILYKVAKSCRRRPKTN